MPLDLDNARDHPANILKGAPASVLLKYEREHHVTFAALDNDALLTVYQTYASQTGDPTSQQAARALASAVADLLGLED